MQLVAHAQLIGNAPPISPCHVANFGTTIYYTDHNSGKNYYCDTMVTPHVFPNY